MSSSLTLDAKTTDTVEPENRVYYPALDGLRAIAFLMVLCQHYISLPWGWTGVNIFFVLSGFLITGILLDTRDKPDRARTFYVRRTLRIFPLYYGIFLALLLLTPIFHWKWDILWLAWPLYLGNFLRFLYPSFTNTGSPVELAGDAQLRSSIMPHGALFLGHFWSLCVEEQFYLVWPWIVFWTRSRRTLLWICTIVVVLVPFARVAANHLAPAWMVKAELVYRVTPFQLDSLLLGGLVALLYRGKHRKVLLSVGPWIAGFGLLLALSYVLPRAIAAHSLSTYVYPLWKQTWGLTCVNFITAGFIICCLQPALLISRLLSLRPLRWLGRISYGAYVFHDIFHSAYTYAASHTKNHFLQTHRNGTTLLLALIGTMLLAELSYRFFETPFLKLKDRFTSGPGRDAKSLPEHLSSNPAVHP